ncbi:MAG: transposase [Chloroflexi bacterium]|nr:transposase [Chloroflexota bacterium]
MGNENVWVLERVKLYELMKTHPDWSLRHYGRELGHDLQWVRRWSTRIRSAATITLDTFRSRSRAPHHPPKRIPEEAKALVGELRQVLSERFHRRAGAKTILYGLQQYQKLHTPAFTLPKALSTITQILHELGWITPRCSVTGEPLVLPELMEEWEMDFGEIYLGEEGVLEFFVVVDRGSSRLVYLEGGPGYNAETALEAVVRLFETCGLPKRLRFDRDVRLWGAWTRDSYPSPLVRFLRVLGVEDIICPPHRPDKEPVVERCIGTLKHEWLARFAPTALGEALDVLAQFPLYYNNERPHQGKACANQPPAVAFPVVPTLPSLPQQVDPDEWLQSAHGRIYRRWVNSSGTIQIDRHTYSIGSAYAKQQVLVHLDAKQHMFLVSLNGQRLKQLTIQGLYRAPMDFAVYLTQIRSEARTVEAHHRLWWGQTGRLD